MCNLSHCSRPGKQTSYNLRTLFVVCFFPSKYCLWHVLQSPVSHEEAVRVEPVCLFPVKKGRLKNKNNFLIKEGSPFFCRLEYLSHRCQPEVTLGNFHLAAFALGSAWLGILTPIGKIVRIVFLTPHNTISPKSLWLWNLNCKEDIYSKGTVLYTFSKNRSLFNLRVTLLGWHCHLFYRFFHWAFP